MNNDSDFIPLWPQPVPGAFQPALHLRLHPGETRRPFVLVVPGGGYSCRVDREEGEEVCDCFLGMGLHTAVLQYRYAPQAHFPEPMRDLARAVRMVRCHADDWRIDPQRIAVCGFSAGGHLCAWGSVRGDTVDSLAGDAADAFSPLPDATVLSYAVVSGLNHPHMGSFQNLLGKEVPTQEELAAMSAEQFVTAQTPPAFIWCTAADETVPWQNSAAYANACLAAGVEMSLHIYPNGGHGTHLGQGWPDISSWPALAAHFIKTFRVPDASTTA